LPSLQLAGEKFNALRELARTDVNGSNLGRLPFAAKPALMTGRGARRVTPMRRSRPRMTRIINAEGEQHAAEKLVEAASVLATRRHCGRLNKKAWIPLTGRVEHGGCKSNPVAGFLHGSNR
jgi:hypothetical protein